MLMMTLEHAEKAIAAAKVKARSLGVAVTIVVVDDHGKLIAASRMDGALHISPEIALSKAYTSANLRSATSEIAGYAGEGKPYYGLQSLLKGRLTTLAGGVLVMKNGEVIGAVGVGGSQNPSQDEECANAAKEELES